MSHIFRTLTLTAISDGSRRRRKSTIISDERIRATSARENVNIESHSPRRHSRSAHALRRNPRPRTTPLVSSHFLPPHRTRLMGNVASQHYDGASPDEHFSGIFRARKSISPRPAIRHRERRRVQPSPPSPTRSPGRAAAEYLRCPFQSVFRARFGPRRARATCRASDPGPILLRRFLLTCASSSPNRRLAQSNTTRRTTSTRALWTTS